MNFEVFKTGLKKIPHMARGVEGKLRQRTAKAETRQKEKDEASVEYDGEVIEMFPDSLINSASSGKQGGGCCGGSTAPPPPKVSVEDKINKAKREREAKSEGKDGEQAPTSTTKC